MSFLTLIRQNMTTMAKRSVKTIIVKPRSVLASSFALTVDILETANRVANGLALPRPFQIDVHTPRELVRNRRRADLVVLPGLGHAVASELDEALATREADEVVRALTSLQSRSTLFATSCTGVFAFGMAGLLENKRATTTWWLSPQLRARFPSVQVAADELVVEDGNVVTAGAALAHIDLLFYLVERFAGTAVTEHCRRFLVVDSRQSQVPYTSTATLIASDPELRKAESFVHKNVHKPIGVADIARAAGLGSRTLARRLETVAAMTPSQFLQRIRVARAIRLATTSRLPNDEIASRVGYSDATSLRRVVKRQTGKTLEAFRES